MKITVDEIPPSNNKFIGRNARWEYQQVKTEWHWLIKGALKMRPATPHDKVTVRITYYFPDSKRRDPDNYSGKMILDALVRERIIKDDSFFNIKLELVAHVDKKKPRTEIEIFQKSVDIVCNM